MLSRSACRTRVLTVAVFVALWNPTTGNAADPFYDRLLRDGVQSYSRGDYAHAAKTLRLACFGLLDEPTVLARGLTYLALAQAENDDESAFAETFDRVLEIEDKFQAFSQLELDDDLKQAFEAHLHRQIEVNVLNRSPAFRHVARRKLEEQVHALAPAERRLELERLAAAEPENSTWDLLLAELKLASGDFEDVLTTTESVLAHAPQLARALCLRGRAEVAIGSCQQALVDLESCHELVDRLALTEARLRCLVRLRDWQSASMLLTEVATAQQKKAPFKQLAREVRKGLKVTSRLPPSDEAAVAQIEPAVIPVLDETPPSSPAEETAGPSGAESADPSTPVAVPNTSPDLMAAEITEPKTPPPTAPLTDDSDTWPPELKAELERNRQLLLNGSREQLDEAFSNVSELATRYRQLTEPQHLAAEIAYRLSRWPDVITFFERGGSPNHSDRLFYLSVALFETGDQAEARRVLRQCLPTLEMTPFVRSYVEEILGTNLGDPTGR